MKAASLAIRAMALSSTASGCRWVKGSRSWGEKSCWCARSTGHWSFQLSPCCGGQAGGHAPVLLKPPLPSRCSPDIPPASQGPAVGQPPPWGPLPAPGVAAQN